MSEAVHTVNVPEIFGSLVFDDKTMKERLPKQTYKALKKTIQEDKPLDINVANIVANAMKDWAVEHGCTHYTHWFQPMTGVTAEKHDSFINPNDDGTVIMEFSGKELIKGEPDASSFPSGGIRATFEARGYTTWDPTSYAFIKDGSLCIPTAFCSYTGDVLDKKTPLLRSMEAVSREAMRVIKAMGDKSTTRITTTVGPEQEYFLIDKAMFDSRKDLTYTGRTLYGARAPKGQELEDHYFGKIKDKVSSFMKDLDCELWKLGIYAKTKHNEVAPAQHELAPIFTTSNLATDHNQLTMEMMKRIANRHGMECLLHEKPFAGVNGSGKHNNWSIGSGDGANFLNPGKDPINNKRFLIFLSAVIKAVDEHQDLLRISAASAGNDHRLGANEAPPAIVSMFIGSDLEEVLESIAYGKDYEEGDHRQLLETGVAVLPDFKKDTSDRNRTSPFAFTGNKFEFRMLGSNDNIACPNIMINTMVAEALSQFADILEKADDVDKAVYDIVKNTYRNHKRIIFNGNNYAPEWVEEAKKRGLLNLRTTPAALSHYCDEKNRELFKKHRIYSDLELHARCEILLENYSKTINIEALTMIDMARKDIIPAVSRYVKELVETAGAKKALSAEITSELETELAVKLSKLQLCFSKRIDKLDALLLHAADIKGVQELADYYADEVFPAMQEARIPADEMEMSMDASAWPYASYGQMLYSVK